jgi:hypothetical protein
MYIDFGVVNTRVRGGDTINLTGSGEVHNRLGSLAAPPF